MTFLVDVGSGVAASGILTFSSSIYRRFSRANAFRRAVRSASATSVDDGSALNNLSTEIRDAFSKEGILTVDLDRIFKVIGSSDLPSHLISCATINFTPKSSLRLISHICGIVSGQAEDESSRFAEVVFKVITNLVADSRSGVRDDFEYQGSFSALDRRVRRKEALIAKAVSSIDSDSIQLLKVANSESDDDLIFRNLCENIFNQIDDVDVHSADGNVRRVSISDIYVSPSIYSIPDGYQISSYKDLRSSGWSGSHIIDWNEFFYKSSRSVLLGDPGGGKSTFSKKICSELAKLGSDGGVVMPIFFKLRSYIAVKSSNQSTRIFDFIISELMNIEVGETRERLEALLSYWLRIGRVFICFDGLDEVLTAPNRLSISKEIQDFCDRFPLSKYLVTSRFVGYNLSPIVDFDHFAVGPLSSGSISDLFDKVHVVVIGSTLLGLDSKRSEFIKEAKEKAYELITNPLLLTLIIIVHSRRRQIPDNRADLYGFCAELLFDRWDGYRDIKPHLPERYRLYDLLMYVSSILLDREEYGGTISKSDLTKEAKQFFLSDYIDHREGRAAEAAQLMVEHLVGRSWILHEVGEDLFEFTHRTFL